MAVRRVSGVRRQASGVRRQVSGIRYQVLVVMAVLGLGACEEGTAPVPATGFTAVAAGAQHSCGLSGDGAVYCWGRGYNGELGIGTLLPGVAGPVHTATAVRFRDITAGYYHTCGLGEDDRAYCWGWNRWGQVGVEDTESVFVREPTPVAGGHAFTRLAAGWYHTCGVTRFGEVLCWGNNEDGQLGDGTTTNRSAPTPVAASGPFREVGAGAFHSCATDATDRAYCWGRNIEGQLGTGSREPSAVPLAVAGGEAFRVLDGGRGHTCGVTGEGSIYCWGSNNHGELGTRSVGEAGLPGSRTPAQVARSQAYVSVSAGTDYTCAVDEPGTGYCWGAGVYGQLGLGTTADENSPRVVSRPSFSAIAASNGTHTCGVTPSRQLYCWGSGEAGQLGNPSTTATALPLPVVNPEPF